MPDENLASCVNFLGQATAFFVRLGVTISQVMTDNCSGCTKTFALACDERGIQHLKTSPCTPETNARAWAKAGPWHCAENLAPLEVTP